MTDKKLERPLFLDMPFEEALARFTQTDPEEVESPRVRRRKGGRVVEESVQKVEKPPNAPD